MSNLIQSPNLHDHDGFYAELIAAHSGLTDDQSQALNAQLILILANHIGDRNVLSTALKLARQGISQG